jgi:hypothetical protein
LGFTTGAKVDRSKPAHTGMDGVIVCVRSTYLAPFNALSYVRHNGGTTLELASRPEEEHPITEAAETTTMIHRIKSPSIALKSFYMLTMNDL